MKRAASFKDGDPFLLMYVRGKSLRTERATLREFNLEPVKRYIGTISPGTTVEVYYAFDVGQYTQVVKLFANYTKLEPLYIIEELQPWEKHRKVRAVNAQDVNLPTIEAGEWVCQGLFIPSASFWLLDCETKVFYTIRQNEEPIYYIQ